MCLHYRPVKAGVPLVQRLYSSGESFSATGEEGHRCVLTWATLPCTGEAFGPTLWRAGVTSRRLNARQGVGVKYH
jgi:hypothetical protein